MPQKRLSGGLHGRARDTSGQDRSDHEAQEEAMLNSHTDDATGVQALEGFLNQHSVEAQQDESSSSDDNEDDHGQRPADGQLVAVDGQVYRGVVETGDGGESAEAQEEEEDVDDDEFETEYEEEEEDEEEEQEEEEEEERVDQRATRARVLRMLIGGGYSEGRRRVPEGTVRLPVPIQPLQGDLAARINADTSARDVGQSTDIWASLDSGFDSSRAPVLRTSTHRKQQVDQLQKKLPSVQQDQPQVHSITNPQASKRHCAPNRSSPGHLQQQQQIVDEPSSPSRRSLAGLFHSATSIMTRGASRRATAAAAEPAGDASASSAVAADPGADDSAGSSSRSCDGSTGFRLVNTTQMLFKREVSLGREFGFSQTQQRHLMCHRTLPLHPQQIRDSMQSRAYIGQYSASGDFFIAAYQDRRVRLYDTQNNWRLRKDVTTRMTRWTITDTTLSPDQRLLVYASISPVAFVVNVGSSYDIVESRANITELHEPLAFDGSNASGEAERHQRRGHRVGWVDSDDEDDFAYQGRDFGIWSIAWSPQGGQLIAGTNDESVYVYDVEFKRCLMRLAGHKDDVNAVAYLHGDTNSGSGSSGSDPNIIVSGSDDHMVRVWDIRDRSGRVGAPNGVLVGHTDGITHICPKGDGYHLISNSKDQTIKLWDVRAALSPAAAAAAASRRPAIPRWDYRWEEYPAAGFAVTHPDDVSLMTYRGHSVLQTLIRAYFSPMHTTGQRYIYAGSSDGTINAWDVISGKPVAQFEYHRALVRDCSWHPYESELTTVSWDGSIVNWGPGLPQHDKEKQLQQARWGDVGRYH